ncbi:MAG: nucleotidyltransferase family protein [Methanosarcinaceae archaeon]|nr:nucleotidyltransferase family protein [Methanosarcinaceae archaeon]
MDEVEYNRIKMGDIKFLIKEHKDEIRQMFRAEIVGIFGSYARGEDKVGSDIDVLVNFDDGATLFDLVGLDDYFEKMFGLPVDVVSMRALHPMMKNEVLRELVAL